MFVECFQKRTPDAKAPGQVEGYSPIGSCEETGPLLIVQPGLFLFVVQHMGCLKSREQAAVTAIGRSLLRLGLLCQPVLAIVCFGATQAAHRCSAVHRSDIVHVCKILLQAELSCHPVEQIGMSIDTGYKTSKFHRFPRFQCQSGKFYASVNGGHLIYVKLFCEFGGRWR